MVFAIFGDHNIIKCETCLHEFAKQSNENRLDSYVEEWQEVPKYEPFSNILFIWFY